MTSYWCEHAWLPPGEVTPGVRIDVDGDEIRAVASRVAPRHGDHRRDGLTLPGLANVHSHAFHRALRGHTQHARGSFWGWRDQMYELVGRLDPERYYRLARRVYAEMRAVGVTCVGEFHYLHRDRDGAPYADPNAFAHALIAAARDAGIRIALLDTCYLTGGIGEPVRGVQRRFSDGDVERWAERAAALHAAYAPAGDVTVGAAIHSVRAVPPEAMEVVAAWAAERNAPLHVHLSEQPRENEECLRAYGLTPTRLLHDRGVLGPGTTVVHATHLTDDDVRLLGGSGCGVALCPTTERDLADGIGPAPELAAAGSRLALGSDGHAEIDLLGEARALEHNERLRSGVRGRFAPADLLRIATENGHQALGQPQAGMLVPGAVADLVTVAVPTEADAAIRSEFGGAGSFVAGGDLAGGDAASGDAGPTDAGAFESEWTDVLDALAVFAAGPDRVRDMRVAGSSP